MKKCKYHKKCKWYNKLSGNCNSDLNARNYYGIGKPCGCYRRGGL